MRCPATSLRARPSPSAPRSMTAPIGPMNHYFDLHELGRLLPADNSPNLEYTQPIGAASLTAADADTRLDSRRSRQCHIRPPQRNHEVRPRSIAIDVPR